MPLYTNARPDLDVVGPNVDILFRPAKHAISAIVAAGGILPAPVSASGQVDTGASGTVVRQGLLSSLGINPVSVIMMSTPTTSTPVPCNVYHVDLIIPGSGVVLNDIFVSEAPLGGQNIQALIGRDVLKHGMLTYIGYIGQFTLSF